MAGPTGGGTALGVARARFVDGLPRKAQELKGALALLAGSPDAGRPREEMRRRLHALYASAQVFRIEALSAALKEAIENLDDAREEDRPLTQDDLDALAHLAATLPSLAGVSAKDSIPPPADEKSTMPSVAPPPAVPSERTGPLPAPPRAPSSAPRRRSTLRGVHSEPPPRHRTGSYTAARSTGSERPRSRPPTLVGAPLETVVSVLVVDRSESQAQIAAALDGDRFEVLSAADPEEALRIARSSAPDVVLADRAIALRDGVDLIARLRSDPLTDFVPVILLHPKHEKVDLAALEQRGADAVMAKPATPAAIMRVIGNLTGLAGAEPWDQSLGDVTVEEVAARLSREIQRGLVEAAAAGKDVKVALGDGSDLLAAAWSTIARARSQLAERSGGQVRFRDHAKRGGPAFMTLVDDDEPVSDELLEEVSLEGRRVVVADDDPAVVWFFAGLLREQGADVVECEDGLQALKAARARRPDVLISDILMPQMDGLALCREIQRDPALSEIPVILLSWKEDFLQRMRELRSGASGYLRKEAASTQILTKVRDVLRPRVRLEKQLEAGGEVRGRIDGVGVLPLLRTVAEHRPDARVTVRDAWNLFEVDMRGGVPVDVTRTATDGTFSRGARALPQLAGVTAGRFTIAEAEAPVRPSLTEAAMESLDEAVEKLGALVDAVSGKRLAKVKSLEFDEDVLGAYLRTSTTQTTRLVERIREGQRPTELLVLGEVGPQELEGALLDMARRGAIVGALGEAGEDLVADALTARRGRTSGLDWLASEESTGDIVGAALEPPEPEPTADEPEPKPDDADALLAAPTNPPPPELANEPAVDDEPELEVAEPEPEPDEGEVAEEAEPVVTAPREEAVPEPEPEPKEGGSVVRTVLILGLCGAVGYFGWSYFHQRNEATPDTTPEEAEVDEPEVQPEEPPPPTPLPPPRMAPSLAEVLSHGATVEGIEGEEEVGATDGLLVVREPVDGVETRVALGRDDGPSRELGTAPLRRVLPEGRHQLIYRRGADEKFRYVFVRAGQTRVVTPE